MNNEQWRDEYVEWLERFNWQLFCSLTFRPLFSNNQRRWRIRQWANELGEQLGTKKFSWIAVPESGRTGQDHHYHALIGGLRSCDARARLAWMRRWRKLAGDARIDPYTPNIGGIRYILKSVGPDDVDDIEIHISSQTPRLVRNA